MDVLHQCWVTTNDAEVAESLIYEWMYMSPEPYDVNITGQENNILEITWQQWIRAAPVPKEVVESSETSFTNLKAGPKKIMLQVYNGEFDDDFGILREKDPQPYCTKKGKRKKQI